MVKWDTVVGKINMIMETYKDFTKLIFETNELVNRFRFLRPQLGPRLSLNRSKTQYTITLSYPPDEVVLTCQRDSDIMFNQDEVKAYYALVWQVRDAVEEIEAEFNFDRLAVGFNVTYLLDALMAIDTEQVSMELKDANSSCLVSAPDSNVNRHVVMPLKL